MFGFNWLDWIFAFIFVFAFFSGFKKGAVSSLFSLIALILTLTTTLTLSPIVASRLYPLIDGSFQENSVKIEEVDHSLDLTKEKEAVVKSLSSEETISQLKKLTEELKNKKIPLDEFMKSVTQTLKQGGNSQSFTLFAFLVFIAVFVLSSLVFQGIATLLGRGAMVFGLRLINRFCGALFALIVAFLFSSFALCVGAPLAEQVEVIKNGMNASRIVPFLEDQALYVFLLDKISAVVITILETIQKSIKAVS